MTIWEKAKRFAIGLVLVVTILGGITAASIGLTWLFFKYLSMPWSLLLLFLMGCVVITAVLMQKTDYFQNDLKD